MKFNRRDFLQQLALGSAGALLLPLLTGCRTAQPATMRSPSLPRSSPESVGVSSKAILSFLEAVAKSKHEFHSFVMTRRGRVIAEGWWSPYRPEYNHTMYSMSKSFTSTAVGLAAAEGKLKVQDKVAQFFPEDMPASINEHLAALTIKDLLTMSAGHDKDPTFEMIRTENWTKTFLAWPFVHKPGTRFVYNSGATYLCSAIVQKVTGEKLLDYLKPRLFDPLKITGMTWESCPRGVHTGGWGLGIATEGLAKFGQLYLQQGRWENRQILPASWVAEATSKQVQQPIPPGSSAATNDWVQGYGYQFWRCRHNGFRGDGAFGQYTIMMPEQEVVVAITSEVSNMQNVLDLVYEHLLPGCREGRLAEDLSAEGELRGRLETLELAKPAGERESTWSNQMSGRTFDLEENKLGLTSFRLDLDNTLGEGVVTFQKGPAILTAPVGLGRWKLGTTALPGTPPSLVSGASRVQKTSRIASAGAWKEPDTFEMFWRYIEMPHHDTITCQWKKDRVEISFLNSQTKRDGKTSDGRPVLVGKRAG